MNKRLVFRNGSRLSNLVAITFDDGPHKIWTPKFLDLLNETQVKATFFLVGKHIKRHPEIVSRLLREGHELGNHTFNHILLTGLDMSTIYKEIQDADALVRNLFNLDLKLFRPPKGKFDLKALWTLTKLRKKNVLWSLDPKDFSQNNSQDLISYFNQNPVKGGDIILLHDNNNITLEILHDLITEIKSRNMIPVTISKLFE